MIEVFGVATNSSGRTDGVARAPAALRRAGLVSALSDLGVPAIDAGDIPLTVPVTERGPSGLLAEDALIELVPAVSTAVAGALAADHLPLLIGGDCPVLLGAVAAGQETYGEVGLLFLDGHEDAWPPRLSTTGEAADSELWLALALEPAAIPPGLRAVLPSPPPVSLIGPRDADELAQAGVASLAGHVPLKRPGDLPDHFAEDLADADAVVADAVAGFPSRWWLHVDLDVLSTSELPAVDYPQPGGLTWNQLTALTRAALDLPGCFGWSVCIYNPDLDPTGSAARRVVHYVVDCASPRTASPTSSSRWTRRDDRRPGLDAD